MMLSRTTDYAMRAAILLARHHGERRVSADEVASVVGAPRNYMSKILNALARQGVLTSMRGPGGGFALARSPNTLPVATVIDVFPDARLTVARCLINDRPCDALAPCSAHQRWTTITRLARDPLLTTTVGELCGIHRFTSVSNTE